MIKNKLIFLLFILLSAFDSQAQQFKLLVTIRPLYGIVKSITGDRHHVEVLITNNQSPHHYSMRPSDIKKIKDSNLIFMIDREFEYSLASYLTRTKKEKDVVMFSQNPSLKLLLIRGGISGVMTKFDMHFWLSPENAEIMAKQVLLEMIKLDPAGAQHYQNNFVKFKDKLSQVDQENKNLLRDASANFISFHDAYQYFSNYYHLHNLTAVVLNHNAPPSASFMIKLEKLLKENEVRCVLYEASHSSEIVQKLATMQNLQIVAVDSEYAAHIALDQDIYLKLIEDVAKQIQLCAK